MASQIKFSVKKFILVLTPFLENGAGSREKCKVFGRKEICKLFCLCAKPIKNRILMESHCFLCVLA